MPCIKCILMHCRGSFQIFGEQIYYGSPYDRPEVLDFPTYAACRFLDTSPNNPVSALRAYSAEQGHCCTHGKPSSTS